MIRFRILYLSNAKSEAFRLRPPNKAVNVLRRSHYEEGPQITASSPYDLWGTLREQSMGAQTQAPKPLGIGDALETGDRLLVCNYWGFDPAEWRNPNAARVATEGGSGMSGGADTVARARA